MAGKQTRTVAIRFLSLAVGIVQSTVAFYGAVRRASQHQNKSTTFVVG